MSTEHPESSPAGIYSAMAAIMGEVSPIAKGQRNNEKNFQYRGIDDVYNALNPLLAEHRVFMVPTVTGRTTDERTTKSGNTMNCVTLTVEYRFFHADGSFITCTVMGEGRDTADKATNKAMAAAHKYALLQTFCIPTADLGRDDPDRETPEPVGSRDTIRRLDLAAIRQTLAGLADVAALEAYWPKVSVQEAHPDYPQLAHLFVTRREALLAAQQKAAEAPATASAQASSQTPITLAGAVSVFAACTSPAELATRAKSLGIVDSNPDFTAIAEAYKARLAVLNGQAVSAPKAPVPTEAAA